MATLKEVYTVAKQLFEEYQLTDWNFRFDKSRTRYGLCDQNIKTISINPIMAQKNTLDRTTETIKHEIAHAIVGCKNGHNEIWAAQMIRMGLSPAQYWHPTNTIGAERFKFITAEKCKCGLFHKKARINPNLNYHCRRCGTIVRFVENPEFQKDRKAAQAEKKFGLTRESFDELGKDIDF